MLNMKTNEAYLYFHNIRAETCDFQQCGILTQIDSDISIRGYLDVVK